MSTILDERRPLRIHNRFDDPIRRGLMALVRRPAERILRLRELNDEYEAGLLLHEEFENFSQCVLDDMRIDFMVSEEDAAEIPREGPVVAVANHPFGGIEGLMLEAVLRRVRPDVKIMANYMLHALPALRDTFIFVDPFGRQDSSKRNLASIRAAMRFVGDGGALGVFPAGEVSHATFKQRGIMDPPWSAHAARIALRTNAVVVPVYFHGRNSMRFQLAGLIHPRLRTILLPREFLNKRDKTLRVAIGRPIDPGRLRRFESKEEVISYIRMRTYLLRGRDDMIAGADTDPDPSSPDGQAIEVNHASIVGAAISSDMAKELADLPADNRLLRSGDFQVYCCRAHRIPNVLHEIGRLREISFRKVGEGTGRETDLDRFDSYYVHLFVYNHAKDELVGAYRLGLTDEILPRYGIRGLYTSTLFSYKKRLLRQLNPAIEMGRSFVRLEYQRSHSALLLLWKGIGRFLAMNPEYRMLFGPVSISNDYQTMSKRVLMEFLRTHLYLPNLAKLAKPRTPVHVKPRRILPRAKQSSYVVSDVDEMDDLIREIEGDQRSLPVLLRQYLKLNAKVLGFNLDPDFGNAVDGLMVADLIDVDRRILNFHMGKEAAQAFLDWHEHRRRRSRAERMRISRRPPSSPS
jgi:putative hemolysin